MSSVNSADINSNCYFKKKKMLKGSEEAEESNLRRVKIYYFYCIDLNSLGRPPSDDKGNEMNGLFVVSIIFSDWLNTPSVTATRTCK